VPRVRVIEMAPVAALLALCIGLTVAAGPAMRYMQDAAQALHAPRPYIEEVLSRP
jgi:multicomponent K+:H+ antiporter subunit D